MMMVSGALVGEGDRSLGSCEVRDECTGEGFVVSSRTGSWGFRSIFGIVIPAAPESIPDSMQSCPRHLNI